MLIGLARTSTLEQVAGLEGQVRDLEGFGCKEIFKEQVSSVAEREQLEKALSMLVLSRFSSGLFRAMFAMKEIENGKEIHRRVSA